MDYASGFRSVGQTKAVRWALTTSSQTPSDQINRFHSSLFGDGRQQTESGNACQSINKESHNFHQYHFRSYLLPEHILHSATKHSKSSRERLGESRLRIAFRGVSIGFSICTPTASDLIHQFCSSTRPTASGPPGSCLKVHLRLWFPGNRILSLKLVYSPASWRRCSCPVRDWAAEIVLPGSVKSARWLPGGGQ